MVGLTLIEYLKQYLPTNDSTQLIYQMRKYVEYTIYEIDQNFTIDRNLRTLYNDLI